MAYTAAHGPPDIDAIHQWAPATGAAPPALNDQGSTSPATLPWIKVTGIAGWRDLPEIVDNREPRTYGPGEIVYPSEKLGKTIVYTCEARATSRESIRGQITGCLRGFGVDTSDEGTMTVTPYAAPGGVVWTFSARVLAVDPDDSFAYFEKRRAPFRWGFTVAMRMSSPFFTTGGVAYL